MTEIDSGICSRKFAVTANGVMTNSSKNKKIAQRALTNPALTKAYEQVLENWFPASASSVEEVTAKMKKGVPL
ncbi:MAG: hypothetical protein KDD62_13325, partial [Bdellovibrionales bacterium]|nr:hypothetical protein [Bdellovibrionales bacterium]